MKSASQYLRIGIALCMSFALMGCRGTIMPRLYSPGSAGQQRATALQYDPYPLDDVAPPVAGARPREYDRPVPEVKRGQAYTPKRPNLQPIPMPSFSLPATSTITAPPALPGATVSPFAPPANVPYQSAPVFQPPVAQPTVTQQPVPSLVRPPY